MANILPFGRRPDPDERPDLPENETELATESRGALAVSPYAAPDTRIPSRTDNDPDTAPDSAPATGADSRADTMSGPIWGSPVPAEVDLPADAARELLALYRVLQEQERAEFGTSRPGVDPDMDADMGMDDVSAEVSGEVVVPVLEPDRIFGPDGTEALRPILPAWLVSGEGRRAVAGWWLGMQWYRARFHAVRAPVYVWRVAWRAPRGMWRITAGLTRWALDTRADALEQALASGTKMDTQVFIQLRENRAIRVRSRLAVLAGGAVVSAVGAVTTLTQVPDAGTALLGAGVVAGLAWAGSDKDRPLIGAAMAASGRYRELTDVIVMRALRAAGLGGAAAKIDKNGNEVEEDTRPTLAQPIARSANGRGYEVLVDLPYGKTAGDAAAVVDKIASGLDVDTAQVFPEPVAGKSRRVSLYVADEDPMLLPAHRSPLARLPKVSVWDPQPLARTPQGRTVKATLLFNSFLVGALPRSGKSFAAKCLVVPAVLDPHCDVTVLDCGGGRDWLPTQEIAVDYVAGDEEEDLLRIVGILNRIRDEARARLARFRTMTTTEMPEDKLTRELAAAGMRPHVIVVDELQNLLRANNKEIRKAALEVLVWLAKTAPKAGYILVMITQRPAANVIDADLRDITSVRLALRTKTRQGSDAVLGADISATGYRTDRFLEDHKGAAVIGGISTGRGGDLQVVRTDLLMPAEFARACTVGRKRREDAGTLRGAAIGDVAPVEITITVLQDVAAVWPGDEAKVHAHVILARLKEIHPDRYAGMEDEAALTRALKPYNVTSGQVSRGGINRNGYRLSELRAAVRARQAATQDNDSDPTDTDD
jgi:S-DNA-T family DNA segregation ATPase FtsK/SpoIIIE